MWKIMVALILIFGVGCSLNEVNQVVPNPLPETTSEQAASTAESTKIVTWTDELPLMSGICFESAFDARGRVFVLRNTEELNALFDLADNSQLCRRPVERQSFDFNNGRILAGLWSYGRGCTARHEVIETDQNENEKKFVMRLRFITEGECNYELVRPFWLGLGGVTDYEINFMVE